MYGNNIFWRNVHSRSIFAIISDSILLLPSLALELLIKLKGTTFYTKRAENSFLARKICNDLFLWALLS